MKGLVQVESEDISKSACHSASRTAKAKCCFPQTGNADMNRKNEIKQYR